MAYEETVKKITLLAGADFSTTGRNRFGKIGTDGKIELCGAAERAAGVVADNVAEDRPCGFQIGGVIMVEAGGTVTAGDLAATSTSGTVITQASTAPVMGVILADGVSGDVVPVLFQPQGAP